MGTEITPEPANATAFASLAAACLIACAFAAAFGWATCRARGPRDAAPAKHKDSVPPNGKRPVPLLDKGQLSATRAPGEWTPVAFRYPHVEPLRERLEDVKPIPYRPFKWGTYFVTMGIRSMHWDEWIELDQEFFRYFKIREQRIATRRDRIIRTLPPTPGVVDGGHAAAVELVHELAEYLSVRYPAVYTVVRHDRGAGVEPEGWGGQPAIKAITIVPLQKTYVLADEDPMLISAMLVQEDLAIMVEGSDGRYYLQAGAVCIPGMWRLRDKIGMSLEQIHAGSVPQFESKLRLSMTRFFARMPLDKPVVRNNYSFQTVARAEDADALDPDELAWARTMKGDEDVDAGEPGFLRVDPGAAEGEGEDGDGEPADVDPACLRLRVERQTLRRLPRTGAVVFTIRVYLTPVEELAKEPGVPGRMASAIRSWPDDVARYKARSAFAGILGYLDARHAEQLASGVTTEPAAA